MKLPLPRAALFGALLLVAIAPIYTLTADAIAELSTPQDRLSLSFEGRAFEDIFGFGFWFSWAVLLVIETAVLGAAWFTSRAAGVRHLVLLPAGAFLLASVLSYVSYQRVYQLYSQPNSAAQSDAFRSALVAPTPSAPGRER
jgi:hypothetical protein